jgi:hypothetical protein
LTRLSLTSTLTNSSFLSLFPEKTCCFVSIYVTYYQLAHSDLSIKHLVYIYLSLNAVASRSLEQIGYDHTPDSEWITGILIGPVEEWGRYIASTIPEKEHSVRDDFLRMSSCVSTPQRKDHDENRVVRSSQIVADQPSRFVVWRQESQAKRSSDIWQEEENDEVTFGLQVAAGYIVVEEDACQD